MISIFKNLRKRTLAKKDLSRYLLYALGEIILVVVGILIALAINNSQEDYALSKKEQSYLIGLQSEFITSKRKLQELIKVNQNNYQGARELLTYVNNSEIFPKEKAFSELLFETFSYSINFTPNTSTLKEMISSGSLKDIENSELRVQLTSWIATLESLARQERELGEQREAVLNMLRTDSLSLRTIFDQANTNQDLSLPAKSNYKSNLKLLQSTAFENNVLLFYMTSYATEQAHYLPLLKDLNLILTAIEAQIKF